MKNTPIKTKNSPSTTHRPNSRKPGKTEKIPVGKDTKTTVKKTPAWLERLLSKKWGIFLLLVSFCAFVLYETILTNRIVLWELHDQSIFLTDITYLRDCLSAVGGLSIYVATFLNAFFLFPWLGACLFTALLLLVVGFTAKAFNLKGWMYPLALIPSLLLVLAMTQNGYMIYILKLEAFAYVGLLGTLVTLSGALLGKKARKALPQSLIIALYTLVAYPVAGIYGLAGTFLMAVFSLKYAIREKRFAHLIPTLTAILFIVVTPRIFDVWVYDSTPQKLLYFSNLPDYWNTDGERPLWLPYKLLAACMVVFSLISGSNRFSTGLYRFIPPVLLLATVILVDNKSFKDEDYQTELKMMEASERGDWNGVLSLAQKANDEPSRLMAMHTNLALYKLDKQSDLMYHYKDGNKIRNTPRGLFDTYIAGPFFYFQYGKMNYCYKWCMENMVEFGPSPSILKYFVLSCAVNGQKELARKYNQLLASSLFYKSQARELARYIDDPSLLEKKPTYRKVIALTDYNDYLDSDHSKMEDYLRIRFAFTVGGPPEMVELCLLANMDLKNPNQFWPAYFLWTQQYGRRVPVHIQEAALLFNHLQKTNYIDPSTFDPAVVNRFNQFLSMIKEYSGKKDYEVRDFFKVPFGDTYWYYFSFINNHSTPDNNTKHAPYSS